jgi:hypothetical protein
MGVIYSTRENILLFIRAFRTSFASLDYLRRPSILPAAMTLRVYMPCSLFSVTSMLEA